MLDRICSLEELETFWSFERIVEANEVLDAYQRAQAAANKPKHPTPK